MILSMRLFVSVSIPEEIKKYIQALFEKASVPTSIRLIPPESLHLTLKFLGDVDLSKMLDIQQSLKEIARRHPSLSLHLGGAGVFPHISKPQVFWVGVRGDIEKLKALVADLEGAFALQGFMKENRAYEPHLTVARLKNDFLRKGRASFMTVTGQFCTLFASFQSSDFIVKEFHLMESHLGSQGSKYKIIQSFPLAVS